MTSKQVGLAFELRRAQVKDASIEMVADVAARVVCDFWADSKRVIVEPMNKETGFIIFVDGRREATMTPAAAEGIKGLRPLVLLEKRDGQQAPCDEVGQAHELLGELIVELLEQGDAADAA